MPARFDITLHANMASIQQIRDLLEGIMASSKFSPREILEAQLAAEEACTNIVSYAYPLGEGKIHIASEVKGDMLIIDIEDSGVPFDIVHYKAELPFGEAKDRKIGGLGIYLIRRLMNDLFYQRKDGKNMLRLTKIHDK